MGSRGGRVLGFEGLKVLGALGVQIEFKGCRVEGFRDLGVLGSKRSRVWSLGA